RRTSLPEATSQMPSVSLTETSDRPSGEKASQRTPAEGIGPGASLRATGKAQRRTLPSWPPVNSDLPSAANATAAGPYSLPKDATSFPVAVSQTWTAPQPGGYAPLGSA